MPLAAMCGYGHIWQNVLHTCEPQKAKNKEPYALWWDLTVHTATCWQHYQIAGSAFLVVHSKHLGTEASGQSQAPGDLSVQRRKCS